MTTVIHQNCLPCPELREILLKAYQPCQGFCSACRGVARWDPAQGHIPRGFIGALGTLDDIELVLLVAEPGNPNLGEVYAAGKSPEETLLLPIRLRAVRARERPVSSQYQVHS